MDTRGKKGPVIYEFRITLREMEPSIYRVFRVSDRITLKKLHKIIQIVMGWEGYHLYEFKYGPFRFGIPDDEFFIPGIYLQDASKVKLSSLNLEPKDVLVYNYDFGDDWSHLIEVQHSYYSQGGKVIPECLKGERACPPEDVGGVHGYQHFLDIISDPSNEEYEHLLEWSGGNFNPHFFDLEEVNRKLAKLK